MAKNRDREGVKRVVIWYFLTGVLMDVYTLLWVGLEFLFDPGKYSQNYLWLVPFTLVLFLLFGGLLPFVFLLGLPESLSALLITLLFAVVSYWVTKRIRDTKKAELGQVD